MSATRRTCRSWWSAVRRHSPIGRRSPSWSPTSAVPTCWSRSKASASPNAEHVCQPNTEKGAHRMAIRTSPTHHLPPLREPTGNLVQELARIATERGWLERVAYVENDTTQSFAEVYEGAARSAAALHARGVQAGDRVL